jgi:hypothetical protein
MTKKNQRKFDCPEVIPASEPDDFCIPTEKCPERIETDKFSSPKTCLDPEALARLEQRIKAANRLLSDLVLSHENNRETVLIDAALERAFIALKGEKVIIETSCGFTSTKSKSVFGVVCDVGRNFCSIIKNKKKLYLPYHSICSISHKEKLNLDNVDGKKEGLKLDPCLRRDLTLHFGKTVANSPELFSIFFGHTLPSYLSSQKNKQVTIKTEEDIFQGSIHRIEDEHLFLKDGGSEVGISLNKICAFLFQ